MTRTAIRTSPVAMLAAGWSAVVLGWRASALCSAGRLGLTLVGAASAPVAAWYGKLLVDELALGRSGNVAHVVFYAVAAAVAAAVGLLGQQLTIYLVARHNSAITLRTESDLFEKVCGFVGLRYIEDPTFQDRLMVAESAASHGPNSITDFAEGSTRAVISILSFLGMVALVWPALAVVLLVAAIPGLAAEIMLANRQVVATLAISPLQRRRMFYRMLLVSEQAAKEVRLFGIGRHFRGLQLDALRRSQDVQLALASRTAIVQAGLSLLGAAISGVAVAIVALRVVRGELTPGDVLLFMSAVAAVQGSLSDLVARIGAVVEAVKTFQRYLEVMALPADSASGELVAPDLSHSVRFEDVWFRYQPDGPWVLRGVSFEIAAGSSVAIVGVNGAGKSTLIKLLCRFYEPERGRIRWDGVDLRQISPESLRLRLAATFQDFMSYDLPARDNIGLGDLSRRDDLTAIRTAAARAGIDDAISVLPRGYDTMLSRIFFADDDEDTQEPGVSFSGGQWQRLALARSLMRDRASLLILDEPSSGLDAEAEHRIHQTLTEFRTGRTSLLISHRLGTLRYADQIVVLDGGLITERGDHDELMAKAGVYARLFTLQGQGYQPATLA
ncbi:ABC transporter ATP-binding protein [Fodinicola acaciae]|uniref:ABC transporter ATP-binding protein n=1 Tax=Fodinicola acaciae TaxID=2681555 RepID=UPI001C9E533B|nr:ABC transporter ATP-binding protein [Fodinicola acaciae]